MKVFLRWLLRGAVVLLVLAIVLASAGWLYLEIAGARLAEATRIESPPGIESLEIVTLGGVEQWIQLRGRDRNQPVLLFLHGGPGAAMMPLGRQFGRRLEEEFVVVHWDQRGAGKSCHDGVPKESLHLDQYLADTLELTNLLRERFATDKIILLGHSWGSVLGILTVARHPELFHAYVGMGQIVDMSRNEEVSLRFVLEQARAEDNQEALAELSALALPYANTAGLMTQRKWLGHYHGDFLQPGGFGKMVGAILRSPEYDLGDKLGFYDCVLDSVDEAWADLDDLDFIRDVSRLDLPVYFLAGRHDYNTPFELVEEFVSRLEAPHKELIWFEDSAHSPNLEEPERFQDVLIDRLGRIGDPVHPES
jgi:pimeloyl-ACP methyl ester carboxylesterase